MSRCCILWPLLLVGFGGWINTGCVAGVHHHSIDSTVDYAEGQRADVTGSVNSIDLGLVADFRYARLAIPFEGHRREIDVVVRDGSAFSIDEVIEVRSLRIDAPVWRIMEISEGSSEHWYPGRNAQRHSLELWASTSVGLSPIHPATATLGLTYYKYGAVAARLYGGWSRTPYSGLDRSIQQGAPVDQRRRGYAPGIVVGLELTVAAGEYALELARFLLERDRAGRSASDRWQ